ncbi:unnamed protein product [Clavelina lepadiformis]|uniref:Uncharacterized protein n=1 Tax=Clavelina lepadiformis TaxID=159417 RepID=A0ABP0FV61_CLALP
MADDVLEQILIQVNESPFYSIQLDESNDIEYFQGVSAKTDIPPVYPAISKIIHYEKDKAPADEKYDPDDNKELVTR